MDIKAFKKNFLEEVKIEAEETGEGSCAVFVNKAADLLIESEILNEFNPSFYTGKNGRTTYRVDGYAFDELDNTLNIVIAYYNQRSSSASMTKTLALQEFRKLYIFVKTAKETSLYRTIEYSNPCTSLVDFIHREDENIKKYRFMIFTDLKIGKTLKNIDLNKEFPDINVEGQIWDLNRIMETSLSEEDEEIEINFTKYVKKGIPCLEASKAEEQYSSYLGVMPGEILADLYDKYGSRILEGNVRSFLSTKVAVNKKIKDTIKTSPQMFFAYNNGITVTATDVEIVTTAEGKFLKKAKDLQIINGGQTTATIAHTRFKDKAELKNIFVQMKLIEIKKATKEEADELMINISKSSNSQNKVNESDFFSSHPFHKRMEQISKRHFAPAVDGNQYSTKWFYERARGQYKQEQMTLTSAKIKEFLKKNPKNQVITKTDLAKYHNSWREKPDKVSKGAQANFKEFSEFINTEWTKNEAQFNDKFFEESAALAIMYNTVKNIIRNQMWYNKGYLANIITYTISLFHNLLKNQFKNYELNLNIIWNKQKLPDEMWDIFAELSKKVFDEIINPPKTHGNVTQWCKQEACWTNIKKIKYTFPAIIQKYLISKNEQLEEKQSAIKDQKTNNDLIAQIEVSKYSDKTWREIAEFAYLHLNLSPSDQNALTAIIKRGSKIPTDFQCKKGLEIIKKAKQKGFKIEEPVLI